MILNQLIRLAIVFLTFFCIVNGGDEFEDYRCKCVCPSFTVVQDPPMNDTHRRVYVDVVAPDNCTCERVVFRTIQATPSFQQRFCPRCVCNYEVRNTTTMKVVVIIIMVAISLLFIYMSFLLCLEPLMNQSGKSKKSTTPRTTTTTTTANASRHSKHHDRQVDDDSQVDNPTQECVFSEPVGAAGLQASQQRSATVLNMVTHGQSKWRKQVQQQRQSVYSKHELLN